MPRNPARRKASPRKFASIRSSKVGPISIGFFPHSSTSNLPSVFSNRLKSLRVCPRSSTSWKTKEQKILSKLASGSGICSATAFRRQELSAFRIVEACSAFRSESMCHRSPLRLCGTVRKSRFNCLCSHWAEHICASAQSPVATAPPGEGSQHACQLA